MSDIIDDACTIEALLRESEIRNARAQAVVQVRAL